MTAVPHEPLDVEGFLIWADTQEDTYELVDGHAVVVEYGSVRHDTLASGLQALVAKASPCRVYGHRRGVRVSARVRRPDVLVICGSPTQDAVETDATYIAEILSPATARTDLTEKVHEYKQLPSIQQYLVLDPDVRQGYLFDRHELGWRVSEFTGGHIEFAGLGVDVDKLYQQVDTALI